MPFHCNDANSTVPDRFAETTVVGGFVGSFGDVPVRGAIVGGGYGRVSCGTKESPGLLSRSMAACLNPALDQVDGSKANDFFERISN